MHGIHIFYERFFYIFEIVYVDYYYDMVVNTSKLGFLHYMTFFGDIDIKQTMNVLVNYQKNIYCEQINNYWIMITSKRNIVIME